jgi:hypothetical protein
MEEILISYLTILLEQFIWDVSVLSTELWMYWLFCIPALLFFCFLTLKWVFLTMPIWLPLSLVFHFFRNDLRKDLRHD